MPIKFCSLLAALLAMLNLLPGCSGPAISSLDMARPAISGQEYILGPGDVVSISLYGDDSFTGDYKVSENNLISLPLIGSYDTSGKTISIVEEEVTGILANGYYRDPRIAAAVLTYRPFYILGEVNKPGAYPFVAGLTLEQAVAIAGGYTYRANSKAIALQRTNGLAMIKIRADSQINLGPGDTVKILQRYF